MWSGQLARGSGLGERETFMTYLVLGARMPRVLAIFLGAILIAVAAMAQAPPLKAHAAGPNAIVTLSDPVTGADRCRDVDMLPNDDGSSPLLPFGFNINFFGQIFGQGYVNNNGNVSLDASMFDYTPFALQTTSRQLIAPFFADVDTRGPGSGTTHWSATSAASGLPMYAGRPAFCVDWVNVGYYSYATDKLNSFQLLLVDRSDIGAGDFDMYFNYDQIQWETGRASGGSGGLGGSSARVGYTNGLDHSFEMPGSAVNGAFLDGNLTTGLISNSRGSTQLGRYIFPVRNGALPLGGSISGTVHQNTLTGPPIAGALVAVCDTTGFCNTTQTSAAGGYTAGGLNAGTYNVVTNPPGSFSPGSLGPVPLLANQDLVNQDLVVHGPLPLPSGSTITNRSIGASGIPVVYWQDDLTLTTEACPNGTATYQVTLAGGGGPIRSGPMTETPVGSGHYVAIIPAFYPNHGNAHVSIVVVCPTPTPQQTVDFDIYIDPSGTVRGVGGNPIAGATVILERADTSAGPFVAVPNNSPIMSLANRVNPSTTDAAGHFGWDVFPGFYKVRAEKALCTDPANPARNFVESAVLPVPPAVTTLVLTLNCPAPPVTTAVLSPAANPAGWNNHDVTVNFSAVPATGGAPVQDVVYKVGAGSPVTTPGATASTVVSTEGTTTISYYAHSTDGQAETARTVTVKLDKTAPEISGAVDRAPNGNGWYNSNVTVTFTCPADSLSAVASCSAPVVLTGEGAGLSATGTATDVAGNSASATVGPIKIDRTAPVTTAATDPTPNAAGWNRTAVHVSLSPTDTLSGVDFTEYSLDGGAWTRYSAAAPIAIGSEGTHTVLYRSQDRAGNLEANKTQVVKIDTIAPEAYLQYNPVARDIQVFGRDSGSGVNPAPVVPVITPPAPRGGGEGDNHFQAGSGDQRSNHGDGEGDGSQTRVYTITDVAGNSLVMVVRVSGHGDSTGATIVSLKYNGGPIRAAVRNRSDFEIERDDNGPMTGLHQQMSVGRDNTQVDVGAVYSTRLNRTVIRSHTNHQSDGEHEGDDGTTTIKSGLALLRLATNQGNLQIEF